jgi:ribulose 1,5-bisphosphate carboxylase large subunit-like protein
MSSESLDGNLNHFKLDKPNAEYLVASYYIETTVDPFKAAVGIAKEQSGANWKIVGDEERHIKEYAAKVVEVTVLGTSDREELSTYSLKNEVYSKSVSREIKKANVKIAYPIKNFGSSFVNMLNAVAGEPHRLGYLSAIKVMDIEFPDGYLNNLQGPQFGVSGIRKKLGVYERPIFCRSGRPAVGLKTEEMAKIAYQVLTGGFDIYKDDELTCDTQLSEFSGRIETMVSMKNKVEDETGEKKIYVANIIDDNEKSMEYYDIALGAGADAVLVAPALQGYSFLRQLRKKAKIPIFAHNSYTDVATRHPKFGIEYSLMIKLSRLCGSDFQIVPTEFGAKTTPIEADNLSTNACLSPIPGIQPCIPVLAGGKVPQELNSYCQRFGSADFMLIIATSVDNHPKGLYEGAKAFRDSWDLLKGGS